MTWMTLWALIPKRLAAEVLVLLALVGVIWIQHQRIEKAQAAHVAEVVECNTAELTQKLLTAEKALEAERNAKQAADAALTQHKETIARLERSQEATNEKLKVALANSRDWGDRPIPDSVRDVLKGQGSIR